MQKIIYFIAVVFSSLSFAASPVHNILDPGGMDKTVDPCDNFYQYSCGGWLKKFKLPGDKSRYWRQGNVLEDHIEEYISALLTRLAAGNAGKSDSNTKLGHFYQSCMNDVAHPEKATGVTELKKLLAHVDTVTDGASLAKELGEMAMIGIPGLFDFSSDQDPKNSAQVITFIDRGGMALPDPDYYLKDDAKSKEIRQRYQDHIAKSLQLAGEDADAAKKAAPQILAWETDLAKHAMKKDDRRDMAKRFHPMTYEELKKLTPHFDWDSYTASVDVKAPKKINVNEPDFMKFLDGMLEKANPKDFRLWLKYSLIHHSAYFLPGPLQTEDFAFWNIYLHGQKELPPPWKYCTQIVSDGMSEALGKAYVASIPGSNDIRKKATAMFEQIRSAFMADMKTLSWMDAETLAAGLKKLDKLGHKIGWPDKWRDYSKMEIGRTGFYSNVLNANRFEERRTLAKIDKPVDRSEWYMQAWAPNAYYADSNNEMVLPLGETVPPVFDPKFSDGANLASLGGSTIGHELTHGFDDAGKDMDADGNFVTWWTETAKKKFDDQSQCFIKQTEAYDIIPGSSLRIRGKATLGENLADNGGVKLAIMVMNEILKHRKPAKEVAGFNEWQQFFLAYGQGWCMKVTDEALRDGLLTDFHPPAEFRVNQVLANQPEFATAFKCKPGSKMAPANRCAIW